MSSDNSPKTLPEDYFSASHIIQQMLEEVATVKKTERYILLF